MRQYIHIHSRNICVSHHFVSQNYAPSSFSVTARPHNVHSGWRLRVALPHRYKGCHHRQAKSHDGTCFNTCMHILSLAARTHAPRLIVNCCRITHLPDKAEPPDQRTPARATCSRPSRPCTPLSLHTLAPRSHTLAVRLPRTQPTLHCTPASQK